MSKAAAMVISLFFLFCFYSQNAIPFYSQCLILDVKKTEHWVVFAYCFNPPLLLRALWMSLTRERSQTGECPKEKQKDEYFTAL